MKINKEELKKVGKEIYNSGYRVVYFYNEKYIISTWVSSIENFMMDFVEMEPIVDATDIPKFVSVEDMLDRWLKQDKEATMVAIYNVNGTCIAKKIRNKE